MILFLGVRPYRSKNKNLAAVVCPNCGQKGSLTGSVAPHYFHLFWIPLFPVYTSRQVSCSYCKRGYVKDELSAEMRRALSN
ncbi:MAG: zinc-ribbon domain-containing protein [Flavobacteriaceae bacterium]